MEKLDVAGKDGAKLSLKKTGTKEGSEDKWDVVSSSVKIEKLDNSVPNGIVSSLASWKANDFADGATLAAAGLDAPALTVTVGLKGGKSVTALIGNKKRRRDTYVKKADAPQIFLVKKFNLERIDKRPMEFRDKTLCDLAAADLTEISVAAGDKSYTLVKNGNDWKATKPPKLELDAAKVTPIAGAFKDWKATGFADDQSLEGQRPRQAEGGHQRQEQGDQVERPGLPGPRRRRERRQGELHRRHGQGPRRLPGAEVGGRPDPGQARRSQEGRRHRGSARCQAGQAAAARRQGRRQEVAGAVRRAAPVTTARRARLPASRGGG